MATQYLERTEGRIAYDMVGSGPLVLCVPSMGDVRAEYRFLTPQLVDAGYTVVTMDQRGLGESSPRWADYSVAGVGSDIVALVKHLAAGAAVLVGDSSGGGAAVWATAEARQATTGLVLIDAFVRDFPSAIEPVMRLLYRLLFAGPWGADMWVRYYATLYPTRRPADFPAYLATLRANLRQPRRLHALRRMLLASKAASEARLPQVKSPALVVFGTKDPDFKDPPAEARRIGEQLHGEVHFIEGAGHYPQAEMPEETGAIILRFLERVAPRQPRGA